MDKFEVMYFSVGEFSGLIVNVPFNFTDVSIENDWLQIDGINQEIPEMVGGEYRLIGDVDWVDRQIAANLQHSIGQIAFKHFGGLKSLKNVVILIDTNSIHHKYASTISVRPNITHRLLDSTEDESFHS